MPKFDTQVQELKYRVLKEVAASALRGDLAETKDEIPNLISPGPKPTMRCCIYKERAIVAERVRLAMGRDIDGRHAIQVIPSACDQCPIGGMIVTDACRGCLAHRCAEACHKGAISFDERLRAHIDKSLCVNCGLCAKACQFAAIANRRRPCEASCKINAISEGPEGIARIDYEKCVSCGACSYACPFGAIMDKSAIVDCIDLLKKSAQGQKYNVYAVVAPSISSQFHYASLGQVVSGIKELGFHSVVEVALGADLTAQQEAQELAKKGFLLSSCCPSFVTYVQKAFPDLADRVSLTLSPMANIGRLLKSEDGGAKVVFVGPCASKRDESALPRVSPYVDCVITFEELQALIDAKKIDLAALPEYPLDNASYYGRIFARSGGLVDAVGEALKEQGSSFALKGIAVSGLDQCKNVLNQIRSGTADFNFVEGMACAGGCIGGPCCLTHEVRDASSVDKYGHESKETTIKGALSAVCPGKIR